ncbi:MAG: hypothetical protein HETSPECPRED_008380 [Heterodermia speciosa]|uniref:XPG-I domain-containing protein n=1 Tax=Heterodermia speciosa TaxID=116794 RepID=A0A8H3G3I0_9LECA|nr:MAG: hypothetical protein HETSPECPRED_008380 [Heterodermia speciosa]
MGINNLYKEIGPGERTALSRLAVQHYELHGRPLRLAIDISIWNFQNQAASGGKNPELRTLYYRLLRLLSLFIQPLFVFDGPNKPPFKRGVRANPNAAAASTYFSQHTKHLLTLFGFPFHLAPGEAEAECALLQSRGIVDAVLSEDVDTLMFGCKVHLRNWSSAGTKGKTPTHVDLYRSDAIETKSGINREGMILIALMSGGDYLPGGIPGCGIKIAYAAAKGGFGAELCKLHNEDIEGLKRWRSWLQHELDTNEGGYFKRSYKALRIPETFPDKNILSYYTHPATSSAQELEHLSSNISWDECNVRQLRLFVADMFEWENLHGAKKFIRGLAPALLIRELCDRAGTTNGDLALQEIEERQLVNNICGHRSHFDTDATPELRIEFVPNNIVKLDLEEEHVDPMTARSSTSSASSADEEASQHSGQLAPRSPRKPRAASQYNPSEPQKVWVLETYVKIGTPLIAENWYEDLRHPKTFATKKVQGTGTAIKPKPKPKTTDSGMKRGALDSFVKATKPGISHRTISSNAGSSIPAQKPVEKKVPAHGLIEKLDPAGPQKKGKPLQGQSDIMKANAGKKPKSKVTAASISKGSTTAPNPGNPSRSDNPWTKSKRPSDTLNVRLPAGTRYSALGIYSAEGADDLNEHDSEKSDVEVVKPSTPILKSSTAKRRHAGLTSNSSADESAETRHRNSVTSSSRKKTIDLNTTTADESEPTSLAAMKQQTSRLQATTPRYPRTPSMRRRQERQDIGKQPSAASARSEKANKKVDGGNRSTKPVSPASDSDDLPSPSVLFSTRVHQGTKTLPTHPRRSPESPSPTKRPTKPKGFVMVRESLEGAWRDVDPLEAERKPTKVLASVDVIDLT